ncbi:MAG: hypothetical protein KatS3mg115_2464 [Candidatus Poribacteria bacterium]|nr:MAG: hypothetical protein KatS3mg115_2464 [Candidatus Poribacteria bacterium]
MEYAFRRDEPNKKTYYELKFTENDIAPAVLEVGTRMGFSMIVNDGDIGEEGQKGWTGWGENAIVFGKDATQTNLIILVDTPLAVQPTGKATVLWGALKRR